MSSRRRLKDGHSIEEVDRLREFRRSNRITVVLKVSLTVIPANSLSIDPKLACNPALRLSSFGLTVYHRLQLHFQDSRHAPPTPQLWGRPGLFLVPNSGRF
jgi:hypothetical protein